MADEKELSLPEELSQQAERLSQVGDAYRGIAVPETIDLYIERGIQSGKRRRRRSFGRLVGGCSAAALLIIFMLGVRVSPVFATAVSQIPGMAYIVELVRGDKGLELAVQNDFIQQVGISDEHDGVRLTVDGVVSDEHRMIIFYSLESLERAGLKISGVKVKDAVSGQSMRSFGHIPGETKGQVDVWIHKGEELPERVQLDMGVAVYPAVSADGPPLKTIRNTGEITAGEGDSSVGIPPEWENTNPQPDGIWSVTFDVDHDKFAGMKEIFDEARSITISGQSVTIRRADVYPIGVSVQIVYDANNEMEIFGMNGLQLVNGRGEVYDTYGGLNEEIYFESPYFAMPQELYLEGKGIRALPKDQLEVEIDLNKQAIVRAPDDRLQLVNVTESGDHLELVFRLLQPEDDLRMYDFFFHEFRDKGGNEYATVKGRYTSKSSTDTYSETTMYIPNADYKGNLLMTIFDYPSYIDAPFRVRLK